MIIHNFNKKLIQQSETEIDIFGVIVPKGFVNLTQMCKVNPKKKFNDYLRLKSTLEYLIVLSDAETYTESGTGILASDNHAGSSSSLEFGVSSGLLIVTKDAIGGDADIFGHYEVAVDLAQWISPEFRVWANRVLHLVIEDKVKTIEFDDAQRNLQWEWLRTQSKASRRKFTDCLKQHIIVTWGEEFYHSPASAKLFAKYTAVAQARITGIPSFNGNRDNCSESQLDLLEKFEHNFEVMFETMYPEMSFDEIFERVVKKWSR